MFALEQRKGRVMKHDNQPLTGGRHARRWMLTMFAIMIAVSAASAKLIRIPTSGRSMWPVIGENAEIVYDSATRFEDLIKGDIIIYRNQKGEWVTHRLFRRMPGGWWAKGVHSPLPDHEYVTPGNSPAPIR